MMITANLTEVKDMLHGGVMVNVHLGQLHSLKSLESGSVLLEAKDGKFDGEGKNIIII